MKPSTIYIISALSAFAEAVNLVGYSYSGCKNGAYVACNNIPSRSCCVTLRGTSGASAGLFQNIPGSATIVGWQTSRSGLDCGTVATSHHVGAGSYCDNFSPNLGQYAGLSWNPSAKKRATADDVPRCTKSVNPDLLALEDGHKFNLTGMDLKKMEELWVLASNGATIDSLPDTFLEHQL